MHHNMHQIITICLGILLAYAPFSLSEESAEIVSPSQISTNDNSHSLNTGLLYVTDSLNTVLRTGPGDDFRTITFLKSGTALKVKRTTEGENKNDWTSVMTLNGTNGWVETSHLSPHRAAAKALVNPQEKVNSLAEQLALVESNFAQSQHEVLRLSKKRDELAQQLVVKQADFQRLKSISETSIQIDQENKRLNQALTLIKIRLEELDIENQQLKESQYIDGITHGVIAVIFGCLMALLIPKLSGTKKRANGWD